MASTHPLAARTMSHLTKTTPGRRVYGASLPTSARTYHRLLQDNTHPKRLMQGFNTSTSSHSLFHTSPPAPSPHIDAFIFPQSELSASSSSEIFRMPILPTNSSTTHAEAMDESVIKPEIHTISADSTHISKPSAMHEVTDGHGAGFEGFDLSGKVAVIGEKVTEVGEGARKEVGVVKELWEGLLDDVLGKKKMGGA